MPFVLPTFNVPVNVWHGQAGTMPPVGPPSLVVAANVSLGRRVFVGTDSQSTAPAMAGVGIDVMLRIMMVAAGTDLRGRWQVGAQDIVEIPAGSGAFYAILDVADFGKGFPNEHRVAWVAPTQWAGGYLLPNPLP